MGLESGSCGMAWLLSVEFGCRRVPPYIVFWIGGMMWCIIIALVATAAVPWPGCRLVPPYIVFWMGGMTWCIIIPLVATAAVSSSSEHRDLTILIVTYNINTNARKLVVAMMTICGRVSFGLLEIVLSPQRKTSQEPSLTRHLP